MKNIIIFGTKENASLANFYFSTDPKYCNEYTIIGFTVHRKFLNETIFENKPVYPFEDLVSMFPPTDVYLFAPLSGKCMNKIRETIYLEGKTMGYTFVSYLSSYATILTKHIGENCFILENNTIQPFVQIGNNCIFWSGNHIGHHSIIHEHCFFTSHVVLSGQCEVFPYSWFGVNATIKNAIQIAEGTLVGMGAGITKSTKPYELYVGFPAHSQGSCLKVSESL